MKLSGLDPRRGRRATVRETERTLRAGSWGHPRLWLAGAMLVALVAVWAVVVTAGLTPNSQIQAAWRNESVIMAAVVSALIMLATGVAVRGIRRPDARLRALVDRSLDLITVVDDQGRVVYQSPAIAQVLGYGSSVPHGTSVAALLEPADAPKLVASLRRAQEEPDLARPIECRWRHADGSHRWLETVCN